MTHVTVHGGARDDRPAPVGGVSTQRAAAISAWCLVAAGAALGAVHYLAGERDGPETWLASVAFGLPLVAAGAVALLGPRTGRPELWIAGGAAACPIAVLSVLGLPAVVPGGVLVALGVTHAAGSSWLQKALAAAIAVLLAGVFALLVFHEDPATWTTSTGEGSSSNIITGTEIAVTVVVVIVALAAALLGTGRMGRAPTSGEAGPSRSR